MRDVQSWHERNHRYPGPIETCWDCGRQKAKCKAKLFRYTNWDEAVLDAQRMNEADGYVKPRGCVPLSLVRPVSPEHHAQKEPV